MTLPIDPDGTRRTFGLSPEPLKVVYECPWLADAPAQHKSALQRELLLAENICPGILEFLETHNYIAEFCGPVGRSINWAAFDADSFGKYAGRQISHQVSTGLMVRSVCAEEGFDDSRIQSLLALGCGYWTYARPMACVFPELMRSTGVELSPLTVSAFRNNTRPMHRLTEDRFVAVEGDIRFLRTLPEVAGTPGASRRHDLVVFNNPAMNQFLVSDFASVFKGVLNAMEPYGRFIIFVENKRILLDGNQGLHELLLSTSTQPKIFYSTKVSPNEATREPSLVRVTAMVFDREDVIRATEAPREGWDPPFTGELP